MTHSKEYQEILKKTHQKKKWWGSEEMKDVQPKIHELIKEYDVRSILDFGCGKGQNVKFLKKKYPHIKVFGYDAAYEYEMPDNVDMIISTDVLEHVEPAELKNTLEDLKSRTNILQYHNIACFKASTNLADGRNAHLIVENGEWWKKQFMDVEGYDIIHDYFYEKQRPNKRTLSYYEVVAKIVS